MGLGYEDDLLRSTGPLGVPFSELPLISKRLSYMNDSVKKSGLGSCDPVGLVNDFIDFLIGQNYYYVLRPDFDCIKDNRVSFPLRQCILYIYTAIGILSLEYDGNRFRLILI
jgi:hypothetical protein